MTAGTAVLLAVAIGGLVVSSCDRNRAGAAVTVTDSAGVRVTTSSYRSRSFATVETEPLLDLGGPNAGGPFQFANIRGIHVRPDGDLWVADGMSAEVRIFGADGSPRKTVGRQGDGPGEFRRIRLLGADGAGGVALWDDAVPRLTILNHAGELANTISVASRDNIFPRAFAMFPDGQLLLREGRELQAASLTPGTLLSDSVLLFRFDPATGTQKPWGSAAGPLWQWTGRYQVPIAFTINAPFDLMDDQLHISSGPDFRIAVWRDGRLVERYGLDRPARDVTAAHVRAYGDYFRAVMPASPMLDAYIATLENPERPAQLPAYQQIVVAQDGNVWALIYEPDQRTAGVWDVYDRNRAWLGQVQTPAGFVPSEINDGRLTGVWRDELSVEYVRVYRFSPTAALQ